MSTAAQQGMLKTSAKHEWSESTMYSAIQSGHLNIVEYLYENKCPFNLSKMYREAVYHGFVDILKYFDSQTKDQGQSKRSKAMVKVAVMARQPKVLEYLHEQGYPFDQSIMTLAVIKNRIECIKFLHTIDQCRLNEKSFKNIGRNGRVEILSLLIEPKKELDRWDLYSVTTEAIRHKQWDILNLLSIANEIKFFDRIFEAAIESGSLKAVTLIHQNMDTPLKGSFLYLAAEYGSVDIIKFLLEQDCPGDHQEAMHIAAQFGKLETFQFLHKQTHSDLTHQMVLAAVQQDFLQVLDYIRKSWISKDTLPWNKNTILVAARYNRIHCLEYMVFHGCPWDVPNTAYTGHVW